MDFGSLTSSSLNFGFAMVVDSGLGLLFFIGSSILFMRIMDF